MLLPHSQGLATPHSHMAKVMGRPVALRARDMLVYRGMGLFLYCVWWGCGVGVEGMQVSIGLLFWLLMVLWLVFGLYWNSSDLKVGNFGVLGGNLLLFILLFLLGWKSFGFIIQG